MVHRFAEAVGQRQMIHADHKSVLALGQVVGRGKMAVQQHIVKNIECADVARPQTDKHHRVGLVACLLFPLIPMKGKTRQLLTERKQEMLGR